MLVTCNHCDTTYNLPDNKAVEGAKLRCTVCKNVFKLETKQEEVEETHEEKIDFPSQNQIDIPNENNEDYSEPDQSENGEAISFEGFGASSAKDSKKSKDKEKNPKSKVKILLFILCLFIIAGGSFALWQFTSVFQPVKIAIQEYLNSGEVPPMEEIATTDKVRLLELRNVRQYNINNEKVGKISVIEGKIVNGFDSPRELIKIEGTLFDSEGKVLTSKSLLAGTSVSLFQLQVLGMEELEHSLGNSVEIVANNTNVAPESIVPFMILFYNPPQNASEFGVRIIDAKEVEIIPGEEQAIQ